MPDVGNEKEVSEGKGDSSRLGEVAPIAWGLHQCHIGPKGRWSKKRKTEVVIRMLRGEPPVVLSGELGVEIRRPGQWQDKALAGMEASFKRREGDSLQVEIDRTTSKIGELATENELLRKRCEATESLRQRRPRR